MIASLKRLIAVAQTVEDFMAILKTIRILSAAE